MVREEYLNLDFMYKFINTLCRRDGYILSEFDFGMLTHNKIDDIAWTLQNGHGYNMVYKFKAYKIPDIELKDVDHTDEGKGICLNWLDLNRQLLNKIKFNEFCFDLSNEMITDYDATKTTFIKNPPFFRLNNQTYYAIYNQPKILKYHFSNARTSYDIKTYMKDMDLILLNLRPLEAICYHAEKDGYVMAINPTTTAERCKELIEAAKKPHFPGRLENKTFLPIHNQDTPYFYTDNVLELTAPLYEDVQQIKKHFETMKIHFEKMIDYKLRNIYDGLSLVADAVKTLATLRLEEEPPITTPFKKPEEFTIYMVTSCLPEHFINKFGSSKFYTLEEGIDFCTEVHGVEIPKYMDKFRLVLDDSVTKGTRHEGERYRSGSKELDYIISTLPAEAVAEHPIYLSYKREYERKCNLIDSLHAINKNMNKVELNATPHPYTEPAPNLITQTKQIYAKIKSALEKLTPETMSVDSLVNISRLLNKTALPQQPTKTR